MYIMENTSMNSGQRILAQEAAGCRMRTKQQLSFVPLMSCPTLEHLDLTRGARRIQPQRSIVSAMTEQDRALMRLVCAHAPAATSAGLASAALNADLELWNDLGFDLIALAELALAIEDAFGIAVDMTDLDGCQTVGDLVELVAARSA
jgi:acyl carrier protein